MKLSHSTRYGAHQTCDYANELQLKEFGKAEADGNAALKLDPRHVKSLQRRAAARNALGKHRAALSDLQSAAEIDPSSKEVCNSYCVLSGVKAPSGTRSQGRSLAPLL